MADLSRTGLPAKANPIADGNRPSGLQSIVATTASRAVSMTLTVSLLALAT